jgi:hypothetical protein
LGLQALDLLHEYPNLRRVVRRARERGRRGQQERQNQPDQR